MNIILIKNNTIKENRKKIVITTQEWKNKKAQPKKTQ